ncbi:hypothetical protein V8C42DRAFT_113433 [Trichoderma barbatum]
MGEEEKAIIHETTRYIETLNKIFDFDKEINTINASHKPKFHGNVVILPREKAITTASNISTFNAGPRHRIFHADGSLTTTPKRAPGSPTPKKQGSHIPSGVAVVYKPPTIKKDEDWDVRYFSPVSRGRDSAFTELVAIARGLTVALAETRLCKDNNKKGSKGKTAMSKVTIFSDCTSALQQINKLRESTITDARLLSDPTIRRLITVSHHLHSIGVQLELRWIPRCQNEGNVRANAAARYAANHQDIGMLLEKRFQWEMDTSSSDAIADYSQQNMPRKKKS